MELDNLEFNTDSITRPGPMCEIIPNLTIREGCSHCSSKGVIPEVYDTGDYHNLKWYLQIITDYRNYMIDLEKEKWGFNWSETIDLFVTLEAFHINKLIEAGNPKK